MVESRRSKKIQRLRKPSAVDVTPLVRDNAQIIQSYAGGSFRVSGRLYEGAVIVAPEHCLSWEVSCSATELSEKDFQPLLEKAQEIDVVLLGTGPAMVFLNPSLKKALKAQGLIVETMDTGAACRTYNVLMAEGRRVAAALLPV